MNVEELRDLAIDLAATLARAYPPAETKGEGMSQPELPVDPPAEPENDPELTDMIAEAHEYRSKLQGLGVDLAEAGLLTVKEDAEWEYSFAGYEIMLEAAAGRVARVSAERREAAADED